MSQPGPVGPSGAPSISIAMPVRDAEACVGRAIRSVLLQTRTDWELLVIDDGSRDRTLSIVNSFTDPRLRVLSDGRRLGLAARLNQAIDLARGRYFARLDADDLMFPDRLRRQADFMDARPELDLVGSSGVRFDERGASTGVLPVLTAHDELCAHPWSGFLIGHPTWLGKLEWFRRHRYDARFLRAQDQELLLRTYPVSRFAGMSDLLIGYRAGGGALFKRLTSRLYFTLALMKCRSNLGLLGVLRGVGGQAAKSGVDVLKAAVGDSSRSGAVPAGEDARRWRKVFDDCSGGGA